MMPLPQFFLPQFFRFTPDFLFPRLRPSPPSNPRNPSSSSLSALEKLSNSVESETSLNRVFDIELHKTVSKVSFTSRNRYGRPYISGRPLLTCDRKKIVTLYEKGMKKIQIAKQLGITHSCVSKVLRRYEETGIVEARLCRTASCSCPGSSEKHDERFCKHLIGLKRLPYTVENILRMDCGPIIYY